MSCMIGKINDITISAGLRRNRRMSRSKMASMRCMSTSPQHERVLSWRCFLQRIAKLTAGLMEKHTVKLRALHGKQRDRKLNLRGGVQHRHCCRGSVACGNSEQVVVSRDALHGRQAFELILPARGR